MYSILEPRLIYIDVHTEVLPINKQERGQTYVQTMGTSEYKKILTYI